MTRCNSERHVGRPAELSEFFYELSIASEISKSAGEKYIQSRWTNAIDHNWEMLHDEHWFTFSVSEHATAGGKVFRIEWVFDNSCKHWAEWRWTPVNGCRKCVHGICASEVQFFWHQQWLMMIKTCDMSLKMYTSDQWKNDLAESAETKMCSQCQAGAELVIW